MGCSVPWVKVFGAAVSASESPSVHVSPLLFLQSTPPPPAQKTHTAVTMMMVMMTTAAAWC